MYQIKCPQCGFATNYTGEPYTKPDVIEKVLSRICYMCKHPEIRYGLPADEYYEILKDEEEND
jgi:hypothetical protein